MADNVLAQVPRKRYPTLDEQMRSDIVNYLSRLKSDFVTSGERAGQGLGQVIDDGNYLEGVPRVVLGGLGALSAPVSAAVSPVLGPLLQPVGEAVDTYVGQPVERATGYPADITNELFLTGVTAGAAPVLRPVLRGSGNFLAKVGDAAEAGLNRVGYTARPQAGTLFSGGGPVKLADDVAGGRQGASVDGMDTKLKPWRTPTVRDGIPSNLQKAYQAGIAVQRAADAEGSDVLSFLTDHAYNPRPGIPSIEYLAQLNDNPTMNAFYHAGEKGYAMPRLVTGQRYGDAPLAGASYNYREQTPELGVSMAKVDAQEFSDYQWADFFNKNRPIKSFEGWLLPKPMTGSDDEPLMVGLRKIANKKSGSGA